MHVGFRVQLYAKQVRWGRGAGESCTLGLREALHRSRCLTVKRSGSVRRYRAGAKQSIAQKVGTLTSTSCSRTKQCKTVLHFPHSVQESTNSYQKEYSTLSSFSFSRRTDRENKPDGSCGHTYQADKHVFFLFVITA